MSSGDGKLVERVQDEVGDPLKFQELLKREKVPVPAFLKASPDPNLGDADLPVSRYTSYEFHRREVAKLWPKAWQLAGREEQVLTPGDHLVYDIVDASVIVMRGDDGRLRGFHNSCLHRGRALRNVAGNTRELRCPFHGFTWDLKGGFKSLPCAWDFQHLDRTKLDLPQVRVETWGGFVFVNFDEHAPPLIEYLGPLPQHFAGYLMDRSCTLVHVQRRIPCNWKVGQEAFFESMHVRHTHPQIMTFIADVDSQYDVLHENVTRMITPSTVPSPNLADVPEATVLYDSLAGSGRMSSSDADAHRLAEGGLAREYIGEMNRAAFGAAAGADLSQATLAELQDAILYSVFPNLQIWAGYFANIVYRFIPDGDDPDHCLFDVRLLGRFPEGAARPPAPPVRRLADDEPFTSAPELGALGAVFEQDMRNLPYMMKGLKASKKGAVSLAHYQESRIRAHHATLDRYLDAK
ncbi:MAG TPA: aromatic ring-hydroxylating dioxygenase subunit alpha [Nevskiaceae bacterium]|nr:aromatic ring-hydroxylating dioxygenase subunit alpha [Nevskiaceae bacterium]